MWLIGQTDRLAENSQFLEKAARLTIFFSQILEIDFSIKKPTDFMILGKPVGTGLLPFWFLNHKIR
jgi:hypothetical protein